jgi:hypothetical protein
MKASGANPVTQGTESPIALRHVACGSLWRYWELEFPPSYTPQTFPCSHTCRADRRCTLLHHAVVRSPEVHTPWVAVLTSAHLPAIFILGISMPVRSLRQLTAFSCNLPRGEGLLDILQIDGANHWRPTKGPGPSWSIGPAIGVLWRVWNAQPEVCTDKRS